MNNINWFALALGFVAGIRLVGMTFGHRHHSDDSHPIGYANNENEVHVHSDFLVHLSGETYDLSADKYQTSSTQELHAHIHLHDNNDEVIHRHDHGVTMGQFFSSLGFTLTDECIIDDTQNEFCSDDSAELLIFVNDERIQNPASYVNQEEDRILVYFGDPQASEKITELLLKITDRACIYSGTCPERGTAPPESCGLTCEL